MKEQPWKAPDWMKPIVGLLAELNNAQELEDLVNLEKCDLKNPNEVPQAIASTAAKAQVYLLQNLYKHNLLKRNPKGGKWKKGDKEFMQLAGEAAHYRLPDNWGFVLFAFPFGEGKNNRLRYCANAKREDVVKLIKEWLKAQEGEEGEEWKHEG